MFFLFENEISLLDKVYIENKIFVKYSFVTFQSIKIIIHFALFFKSVFFLEPFHILVSIHAPLYKTRPGKARFSRPPNCFQSHF